MHVAFSIILKRTSHVIRLESVDETLVSLEQYTWIDPQLLPSSYNLLQVFLSAGLPSYSVLAKYKTISPLTEK